MRRPVAGVVLAACVSVVACGDAPPSGQVEPPAVTAVSGYFVGRSGGGLGASVDFSGFDRTADAVRQALDPEGRPGHRRVLVGIVSIVNTGEKAAARPAFRAVMVDGRSLPLVPAELALGDRKDGAAARARRMLGPRASLPGGGSAVEYLILRGVRIADVARLEMMAIGRGGPVELRPERR